MSTEEEIIFLKSKIDSIHQRLESLEYIIKTGQEIRLNNLMTVINKINDDLDDIRGYKL